VVYYSGFGHTEAIARSIAAGLADVDGANVTLMSVDDLPEPTKADPAPGRWAELDHADAIIMGTPTYMGSVGAAFKTFMERSSSRWMTQAWRDKIAAGFTVGGGLSGDQLNTLVDLMVFSGQHSMIWVSCGVPSDATTGVNRLGSYSGLMAQADNKPPEVAPPPEDHATARLFGARVAQAAERWRAEHAE
jgi:NAD(P)H dehydrogenase (quinone)